MSEKLVDEGMAERRKGGCCGGRAGYGYGRGAYYGGAGGAGGAGYGYGRKHCRGPVRAVVEYLIQ